MLSSPSSIKAHLSKRAFRDLINHRNKAIGRHILFAININKNTEIYHSSNLEKKMINKHFHIQLSELQDSLCISSTQLNSQSLIIMEQRTKKNREQ